MPELPDLEIIRAVLAPRLTGQTITGVEVVRPLVVRDLTGQGFAETLTGQTFAGVRRRGKVLLFPSQSGLTLAINCKLAGRLQYVLPAERRLSKTHVILCLSDGHELRYSDRRTMGQVYLTASIKAIPGWAEMGPEPFDLTLEGFQERLRPYRGEIKGVLTRGRAVAGIGNAYADEICFAARVHPTVSGRRSPTRKSPGCTRRCSPCSATQSPCCGSASGQRSIARCVTSWPCTAREANPARSAAAPSPRSRPVAG